MLLEAVLLEAQRGCQGQSGIILGRGRSVIGEHTCVLLGAVPLEARSGVDGVERVRVSVLLEVVSLQARRFCQGRSDVILRRGYGGMGRTHVSVLVEAVPLEARCGGDSVERVHMSVLLEALLLEALRSRRGWSIVILMRGSVVWEERT